MSVRGANGWSGHLVADEANPVRVALVDRDTLVREGLRLLLDREPGIEVVGDAGSAGEAKALEDPEVLVTELELPDAVGPDVAAALRDAHPTATVVVVTTVEDPPRVQEALAAGAHGYLLKSATAAELVLGVRSAARGEPYLQPALGVHLARWHEHEHGHGNGNRNGNGNSNGASTNGGLPEHEHLSAKEQEVLRLVALGHTNAEIGRLLAISVRTVETHRSHILRKLGRGTRAELVRYAYEAGLVHLRT